MGRNPAIGRQGPAHHEATIPSEKTAKRLQVKQIRSMIGHPATMRRTLLALGLRYHQQTVQLPNNASIRGMLFKVRNFVDVAPAEKN